MIFLFIFIFILFIFIFVSFSLGGGGQLDETVASNANVALYFCFSVFSFISTPIVTKIGLRIAMFIGCLTYVGYAASLLIYNQIQSSVLVIIAGALLG
jgi:hypothetical protein